MTRARRLRLPWVPIVCGLVIATQALLVLRFIRTEQPNAPAYERRMTIDAATYVRQAALMVARRDTLYTDDAVHSAGMQVLTAQVFRLFGIRPLAVKQLNWLLWLAALVLAYFAFVHVLPSRSAAWIATALVASSLPLQRYCGIVQYEIVACAALTALFFLNVRASTWRAAAISGAVIAALAAFRVHFVLLLPTLVAFHFMFPSHRPARRHLALVVGFLAIALPWNVYYSVRNGAPFFFTKASRLDRYLSPESAGFAYPYPKAAEPRGLRFITERPTDYLRLLGRRFTYLSGIERDIWWVEPRGSRVLRGVVDAATARRINAALSVLLALAGVALILHARTRTPAGVLAVGIVVVLVAPHLIMNSSTRFMVPAIPLLTFLQVQLVLFVTARILPPTAATDEAARSAHPLLDAPVTSKFSAVRNEGAISLDASSLRRHSRSGAGSAVPT